MTNDDTTQCVDKLNGLLKGERSACETYRQALEKTQDASVRSILESNCSCHNSRVQAIANKITEQGGQPAQDSGVWGAFAKMMEGGATVFGDKASIAMLEEGEDKGLEDYKNLMTDASPEIKAFVAQFMSKQEATHARMRELKHSMN